MASSSSPLASITSIAVPMLIDNINTDIIYPARFLLITEREQIGQYLFYDWRYKGEGLSNRDFILNDKKFSGAKILLGGKNFGCGSSRENAVWTLLDYGFECVIAPSFGEIFSNNCIQNGLVYISLKEKELERLAEQAEAGHEMTVNLTDSTISCGPTLKMQFFMPPRLRERFLSGLDECDTILNLHSKDIQRFEQEQKIKMPWLYQTYGVDHQ